MKEPETILKCSGCQFNVKLTFRNTDQFIHEIESINRTGLCQKCLRRASPEEIQFISEPHETNDSWRIICPYCGYSSQVECEDECYEEGTHEYECGACQKKCEVSTYIDMSFTATPLEDQED